MSVKWNSATRYSAHPFTTKTGARVHFFCLNYPRIRGWYQARVHPFSSGNGKGDPLSEYHQYITAITTSPLHQYYHNTTAITTSPLSQYHQYITTISKSPLSKHHHYHKITAMINHHFRNITAITTSPLSQHHRYHNITTITTSPLSHYHHYHNITNITISPLSHVSHESFVFTPTRAFTFWGKSRTKASFSYLPLSLFEESLARKLHSHIFHLSLFERSLARKLRFHIFHFQFLRRVSHEMRFGAAISDAAARGSLVLCNSVFDSFRMFSQIALEWLRQGCLAPRLRA